MKWIRWILCHMNLRHRIVERWYPLATSGLSRLSAQLYGCRVETRDGEEQIQYYKCRDCDATMAPFEVGQRGWKESA